jgi:hypothetical protein
MIQALADQLGKDEDYSNVNGIDNQEKLRDLLK